MIAINKLQLLFFLSLFGWMSCSDDEDPVADSDVTFAGVEDSYTAPRGETISVSYTVSADDGLQSIVVSADGTDTPVAVTAGTEMYSGTIDFAIPGASLLDQSYTIDIVATDVDGDAATISTAVITGPVLATVPTTYEFTRDGASTVSYNGQNERLDQVAEIKSYLQTGDAGAALSAQVLQDAYANVGGDGNGFFSFSSTKQLEDKSFQPDLDDNFMSDLFAGVEAASTSGAIAANGVAGLIVRENSGNTVLVDAHGREYTQLIEKGLMGTVMYNQIYNTYFTDARIGADVENTEFREGANYTDMEHHWDEAFGYWNPPLDFTSDWPAERANEDRFWSHYSNTVDPHLRTNDAIMQAFIAGRAAIVNNDHPTKEAQRDIIAEQLEIVTAGVAVHYINSSLEALNEAKIGEAFHVMSEVWTFVNAIKYNPNRRLSIESIEEIKESDLGADGNFWNVTTDGLNKAKNTLVEAYPELADAKDQL